MPSWLASLIRRLNIVTAHPFPIRFVTSRLLMGTGLCRFFSIPRHEYTLTFFPTALSAALWINPRERYDEEMFLRDLVQPGDTVIDVGANIGSITLALANAVGPAGHVLSIEPHPRLFMSLKANIARNNVFHVEAINCALGQTEAILCLTDRREDDQNAVVSGGNMTDALEVPIRPLDSLAPPGPIELLKIDVEGYEYFVLKGATQSLRRIRKIYLEYVPEFSVRYGSAVPAPWKPALDAGFRLFQKTPEGIVEASLPPPGKTMLIAARSMSDIFPTRTQP
jgi:FkbM family methyltransferase